MTNHGGRADEPTSYGLQPPRAAHPPAAPSTAPDHGAGHDASHGPATGPDAGQRPGPAPAQEQGRDGRGQHQSAYGQQSAYGRPADAPQPQPYGADAGTGHAAYSQGSGNGSSNNGSGHGAGTGAPGPVPGQPAGGHQHAYDPTQQADLPGRQDAAGAYPGTPSNAAAPATTGTAAPAATTAAPPTGTTAAPARSGAGAAWDAATDPDAGRLVGGRYRLVSRLGHGGMGTVWKAHDQVVDREVAVKEPRVPDSLPERERQTVYQRMQREARAAARIDHPAVVTVHDVVVEEGRPWIVMELVRGRSLGDVLAEGTLDPREAARVGVEVLGALAAAHEAGVLHRDVKPDNVLLGRNERVVLTDFGIAQVEGEQGLTETGAFVGSPEFIAPERVLGQRPGPESDLWSLGVVLYAAVEGMSPFRRSHHPATLQAVLSAEPQVPARGSGALGTLIMQLLRKEAAARPTAAEARQTLESVARPAPALPTAVLPAPAAGDAAPARTPSWLRRNRKAQLGLGGGVLAAAVALVLVVVNPFDGGASDDAPDGWRTVDVEQRVRATLAAPEDYELSENDDEIKLTDPGKIFTITLRRDPVTDEKDKPTALQEANAFLADYRENYYQYGWTKESVDGSVRATKYHGLHAAELTASYTTNDATDPADLRRRELHYMNDSKVQWQLVVEMPSKGKPRTDGEKLFKDVVAHLDIKDR